jgi:hypothetical protein
MWPPLANALATTVVVKVVSPLVISDQTSRAERSEDSSAKAIVGDKQVSIDERTPIAARITVT